MSDKVKNYSLVIIFAIFIFGTFVVNLVATDNDISKSERRRLAQFPKVTWESIKSGDFMSDFEKYSLDQFVGRDTYRRIKAYSVFSVFRQKDNNKIYIADGHASKYLDNMKEKEIEYGINRFNKLYNNLLSDMNVYYSIIPDKNYFLAEKNGYPAIDYEKFESLFVNGMDKNMTYIDIFDKLSIDDYYKTDIHWRQEKIGRVVDELADKMGFTPYTKYTENSKDGFYGVYYGQSALPIKSEKLIYYTAPFFDNLKVYMLNEKTLKYEETTMYDLEGFDGNDPYDIFLHGAKPAIVIENENATSDKELIVFRDSFGSSLVPLLTSAYKKITVLDLRYISSGLLTEDIVEFKPGNDVLIINYVDVLNSSSILKIN